MSFLGKIERLNFAKCGVEGRRLSRHEVFAPFESAWRLSRCLLRPGLLCRLLGGHVEKRFFREEHCSCMHAAALATK